MIIMVKEQFKAPKGLKIKPSDETFEEIVGGPYDVIEGVDDDMEIDCYTNLELMALNTNAFDINIKIPVLNVYVFGTCFFARHDGQSLTVEQQDWIKDFCRKNDPSLYL